MKNEWKIRMQNNADLVNEALAHYLETPDSDLSVLYESMRYSALSGGKRIRPFLVLEFCRMFGGEEKSALPFACAIECVECWTCSMYCAVSMVCRARASTLMPVMPFKLNPL